MPSTLTFEQSNHQHTSFPNRNNGKFLKTAAIDRTQNNNNNNRVHYAEPLLPAAVIPAKNDTTISLIPVWSIPTTYHDQQNGSGEKEIGLAPSSVSSSGAAELSFNEEEIPEEGLDSEYLNEKTAHNKSKSFTPHLFSGGNSNEKRRASQNDFKHNSSPTSTISTSDLETSFDHTPLEIIRKPRFQTPNDDGENGITSIQVIDESFFTSGEADIPDQPESLTDADRQRSNRRAGLQVACPGFGIPGEPQSEILKALAFRRQKTLQSEVIWGSGQDDEDDDDED